MLLYTRSPLVIDVMAVTLDCNVHKLGGLTFFQPAGPSRLAALKKHKDLKNKLGDYRERLEVISARQCELDNLRSLEREVKSYEAKARSSLASKILAEEHIKSYQLQLEECKGKMSRCGRKMESAAASICYVRQLRQKISVTSGKAMPASQVQ